MGVIGVPEPSGHRDGVFGLLEREGTLLLVANPRAVGGRLETVWDLPGGAVRPGEGLPAALRREWQEEAGLDVEVGDLLLVTDGAKRRAPDAPAVYTWRAFIFRVEASGEPRAGDGIEAVEFVDRSVAPSRLSQPYHEPLVAWLEGRGTPYAAVTWVDAPAESPAPEPPGDLRRLLVLAAAAATGARDLVAREAEAALVEGVPPARLEEALLQVVPYAGFPRTIAAFERLRAILGPTPSAAGDAPADAAARRAAGDAAFGQVYGETATRVRAGLVRFHPALATWTREFAYGRVLARDGLSLLERELLAVGILTAMGYLEDPLLGHMRAAIRLGAGTEDVAAAIEAVPPGPGDAHRSAARALLLRLR